MLEEKIQRRLRRGVIFISCIIAVLLLCGVLFSAFLSSSRHEAARGQISAEAEEYRSRIIKQLKADSQTLSTLAVFLGSEDTGEKQQLAEKMEEANEQNDFLTMAYYDTDGNGVLATQGMEPAVGARLSDLAPEGRSVVKAALEGRRSVSRLFQSEASDQRVFVYGVPVYDGENVIGALVASDHIEIFSDILSGSTVLAGGGYIHMVGSEGKFLVRSPNTVVKEDLNTIFDGPYLADAEKEEVREALKNQEEIFGQFSYEGKEYPFLLEPVGVNGWYLFCVDTGEWLGMTSFGPARVLQITLLGIILLMIFLMLYGYRLLRNYNNELLQTAYHDPLTGAENLIRFRQRLPEELEHSGGSVVALSVRQFPFLSEIFGREKAERFLCQIKETAEKHVYRDEFFCRGAEDRFYFFLRETDQETVRSRLAAFTDEMEKNTEITRTTDYQLAFYCGVAVLPSACGSPKEAKAASENLMAHVLFALDSAKGVHSSYIWFFDTELHKKEELENYIESHMHQALRDGEFRLFLQPKKNLHSGTLDGAEALVRWKTGDGKMIFPDQFIPLFERNGFCVELDLYMAEQACRQIRSWIDRGITPVPISVNQSKLLFFEADYVQRLTELVKKYDIPARLITLEILEGLALGRAEELNEKIARLQAEGFRVSLDDFGSGYSSLNTLMRLNIDEMKLDRGFLLNTEGEGQERALVIMKHVIVMAGQLGIFIVAEGVETEEDEQLIRKLGCDAGQGYLYSRPVSAPEFDEAYMKDEMKRYM